MKRYENPKMEVTRFSQESILTVSGTGEALNNWAANKEKATVMSVRWNELEDFIDFAF